MKLVFDFDGTLHKSDATYVPAFRKTAAWLAEQGYDVGQGANDAEIGYWLGFSAREMWETFAPDLPEELKQRSAKMIGDEMRALTVAGKAELYPQVPETLAALKGKGHALLMLSNCHRAYMRMHREVFSLDDYFDAYYCGEAHDWIPKSELFNTIVAEWGKGMPPNREFIIIGDRFHDMGVASAHGLVSVGCAYGFGAPEETADASVVVEDPANLLTAIEQACELATKA